MLSARLTWPTAEFPALAQLVCRLPDWYALPATNQKYMYKPIPLSLFIAPDVSPGKVIVFFSQVLAFEIVYDAEISLLPLSSDFR